MAKTQMKICSISLIIRDMLVRSTVRYHLTLVKMAITKKSTKKKITAAEGMEKRETSYTVGRNVISYSH